MKGNREIPEGVHPQIDLVYTWVDGNDPEWQKRRNQAIGEPDEKTGSNYRGRYDDNGELRYSLRSAALYAPWIRKIFIVTDGQVPSWLDTSNPRIRIVDHKEIIPEDCLPTFNSVTIEHCLWRIPDLSEKFIYGNDDTFFNRDVRPEDFFKPDGKPIIRLNRRLFRKFTLWFKEKIQGKRLSNYNLNIRNAARLVEKRYGRYFGSKTHHNLDAYSKNRYERTFMEFRSDIEPTLHHKVRDDADIQRNIYSYVALAAKEAVVSYVGSSTSFKFHIDNPRHYAKLQKLNPMLFCLNDSEYADDEDRRRVKEFLETRFPEPSVFEIV